MKIKIQTSRKIKAPSFENYQQKYSDWKLLSLLDLCLCIVCKIRNKFYHFVLL